MEFKGTKGNWTTEQTNKVESGLDVVIKSNNEVIGWLYSKNITSNKKELEANANLIAAAPELLEACKEVLRLKDLIEYPQETNQEHLGEAKAITLMLGKTQKAINKALGLNKNGKQ